MSHQGEQITGDVMVVNSNMLRTELHLGMEVREEEMGDFCHRRENWGKGVLYVML